MIGCFNGDIIVLFSMLFVEILELILLIVLHGCSAASQSLLSLIDVS